MVLPPGSIARRKGSQSTKTYVRIRRDILYHTGYRVGIVVLEVNGLVDSLPWIVKQFVGQTFCQNYGLRFCQGCSPVSIQEWETKHIKYRMVGKKYILP